MSEHGVEFQHRIHLVTAGTRQAPPVLLIHGSGASGACWIPLVPALAGHHHVVRVDLPGCGRSPAPPSYEVPAQADLLAALLDRLGLAPVVAVGHSSGGYVATALTERRPDLVRALALISTGPALDALLPQPVIIRALLAPPLGPLLWRRRSDAMIRKGLAGHRPAGRHLRHDAGGAAAQRRIHRRTERSRTPRHPRRPRLGDLRRR